jgi:hypothetical protein
MVVGSKVRFKRGLPAAMGCYARLSSDLLAGRLGGQREPAWRRTGMAVGGRGYQGEALIEPDLGCRLCVGVAIAAPAIGEVPTRWAAGRRGRDPRRLAQTSKLTGSSHDLSLVDLAASATIERGFR